MLFQDSPYLRVRACSGVFPQPACASTWTVRARALVCFVLRNEGRGRDEEVRKLKGYASDRNITGEIEGDEFRFCNIQFS